MSETGVIVYIILVICVILNTCGLKFTKVFCLFGVHYWFYNKQTIRKIRQCDRCKLFQQTGKYDIGYRNIYEKDLQLEEWKTKGEHLNETNNT